MSILDVIKNALPVCRFRNTNCRVRGLEDEGFYVPVGAYIFLKILSQFMVFWPPRILCKKCQNHLRKIRFRVVAFLVALYRQRMTAEGRREKTRRGSRRKKLRLLLGKSEMWRRKRFCGSLRESSPSSAVKKQTPGKVQDVPESLGSSY
jgi:hypothetical protein